MATYTVPKLDAFSAEALDAAVRELLEHLDHDTRSITDENSWRELRDRWMARTNGILKQVNDLWLKAAPNDQKREVGRRVNELKGKVEAAVEAAHARATAAGASAKLAAERL